jgi:phosphoribosylamine--glycine ligase
MRALVLGSGGREHALAWRLRRDPEFSDLVVAPGNPGISAIARCLPVDLGRPDEVLALAAAERVDLTVVGPEAPLERGVADLFRRGGRAIVGPSAQGAALECSKSFAKAFMERHGVPTARFVVCDDAAAAMAAVDGSRFGFPVVVKADGLAGGKGVVVAQDRREAEEAVRVAMVDRQFGVAGARVVVEECLSGPEVSFFVLADGERAIALGSAQDHKRIFDGDRGPNTGGMGAFAPSPLLTASLESGVMRSVVRPVIEGFAAEGNPYRGFLYVSLMLTAEGPKVIEFNVRFGDPEAQVVLPLIDGPLAATLLASARGALAGESLRLGPRRAVGVVLASRGYPASPESGRAIAGVDAAGSRTDVIVFHAGTRVDGQQLVTAGGRVLTVVGLGDDFEDAMDRAYLAVGDIQFDGMQFRRDIGRKALDGERPKAID